MTANPPPVMSPTFDLYRQGYRDGYQDALAQQQRLPPLTPSAPFVPHPAWIPLRHTGNGGDSKSPPPCGNVSHYLTEKVSKYEPADLSKMRRIDGQTISSEDSPVCGSCHVPINPYSTWFLDYTDAFLEEPSHAPAFGPAVPPPEIAGVTKTLMQIEEDLLNTSIPPPHRRICGVCGNDAHEGRPCNREATF